MIVRTLEGPDVVRVAFTDETIRVEAGDLWTALVTAELASQNTKAYTSTVLNTARLTPDEGVDVGSGAALVWSARQNDSGDTAKDGEGAVHINTARGVGARE